MKIHFDVVGCRLNQSEMESIAHVFRGLGHQIVSEPADADLAIVNTCAVTVKAAADSRKKLRRAGRLGAKRVVATGCWATLYPHKALGLKGVTDVITNQDKDGLAYILLNINPEEVNKLDLVRQPLPGDRARTRAFIKVQEGCDNRCTYCLTRLARGKSQSRSIEQIHKDIDIALAGGTQEIVLSGVQLGAWGRDLPGSQDLGVLIGSVLADSDVNRLRLSSIEPWDIDFQWLALWRDERLCRHLHIPLQSGDDRILRQMGRPITTLAYSRLIKRVREAISGVAVTTDVIAGFPGETDNQFVNSLDFIRRLSFTRGHVFTFSPRPGTAAYKMEGQVPVSIAKERNAVLRQLFVESGKAYRDQFIGSQLSVLWEKSDFLGGGTWHLSGLTGNYLRVYAHAERDLWNKISRVSIVEHHPQRQVLIGEILES